MSKHLYIESAKSLHWNQPPTDSELQMVQNRIPAKVRRRMTRLGLMISEIMESVNVTDQTTIIYASTYSETCTIEKYIRSFPFVSPMGFQMSIHPSAVEQVCVNEKESLHRFIPIVGQIELLEMALQIAFLEEDADQIIILGGEETGTWLTDAGLGSEENLAFCLTLNKTCSHSIGEIIHSAPLAQGEQSSNGVSDCVKMIQYKKDTMYSSPDRGSFNIQWIQ
jgi:hypothetical protein